MNDIVLFDLDDTLALAQWRAKFLDIPKTSGRGKNWDAFFSQCEQDQPNLEMLDVLNNLKSSNIKIGIITGRFESYREHTKRWLTNLDITPELLMMRDTTGRFHKSEVMKLKWIKDIEAKGYRITCVVDDDEKVLQLLNKHQVKTFHPNQKTEILSHLNEVGLLNKSKYAQKTNFR